MEIKSTSKINLGLHVHNKRMDGFHNISTLFQEI
ncbi:4-(cytidine 5'-diphospho)-2-C-methyl-D-erythritol kinase, partial [bacterium]|nr:4-(cytidine 5'-diphospho)-2-C-methyl-D-erythritol kinase [bacterium]